MQKITIDTRILVNGVMYCNSTESAYIDMNNKTTSSYKGEKDMALNYLLRATEKNVLAKTLNLSYTEKAEKIEKKSK